MIIKKNNNEYEIQIADKTFNIATNSDQVIFTKEMVNIIRLPKKFIKEIILVLNHLI